MKINSLTLKNFRNYEKLELDFDESLNIILGENAQGKTNLIEAIYLAAFAKSFRTNNTGELVRFGEEIANVGVNLVSEELDKNLAITIRSDGKKMIKKDGKVVRKVSDLLNNVVVIIFSPDDLRIIKDSPERRRAYINRELSQIKPKYYEQLRIYNDALKQKNSLLKNYFNVSKKTFTRADNLELNETENKFDNSRKFNEETLDVYDKQLADAAYEIIRCRKEFIEKLSNEAAEIVSAISGGKESLRIEYKTSCDYISSPEGRDILYKQIYHNRDKDIHAGSATLGPHRDDIEFFVNDKDAKKFGSQGQQRTIALSLKLAEIRIAKQLLDEYPILLLDDVLSELDLDRQKFLVNQIDEVQLFITSAEINDEVIQSLQGGKVFNIESGEVK